MLKKVNILILILISIFSIRCFAEKEEESSTLKYEDLSKDAWYYDEMERAVKEEYILGYEEEGVTYIRPGKYITRAELATVINRVFGSYELADIETVEDVSADKWYANEIAKAINMKTMMLDTKVRPQDNITREEAFTIAARAMNLKSDKYDTLNVFGDKDDINDWAKEYISELVRCGYVKGDEKSNIRAKDNITRAEFVTILIRIVNISVKEDGKYTAFEKGNVLINTSNIEIENVKIDGDLIVADGVGNGTVKLSNVEITGRLLLRGGGTNLVMLSNNCKIDKIVVLKNETGDLRLSTDGSLENLNVENITDNLILDGRCNNLNVNGNDITVIATGNAVIDEASLNGIQDKIIMDKGASTKNIISNGDENNITGEGNVEKIIINANYNTISLVNAIIKTENNAIGTVVNKKEVLSGKEVIATQDGYKFLKDEKEDVDDYGGGNPLPVEASPKVIMEVDATGIKLAKDKNLTDSSSKVDLIVKNGDKTTTNTFNAISSFSGLNSTQLFDTVITSMMDIDSNITSLDLTIDAIEKNSYVIDKLKDLYNWLSSNTSYDETGTYRVMIQDIVTVIDNNSEFKNGTSVTKEQLYNLANAVLLQGGSDLATESFYEVAVDILTENQFRGITLEQLKADTIKILNAYIETK